MQRSGYIEVGSATIGASSSCTSMSAAFAIGSVLSRSAHYLDGASGLASYSFGYAAQQQTIEAALTL